MQWSCRVVPFYRPRSVRSSTVNVPIPPVFRSNRSLRTHPLESGQYPFSPHRTNKPPTPPPRRGGGPDRSGSLGGRRPLEDEASVLPDGKGVVLRSVLEVVPHLGVPFTRSTDPTSYPLNKVLTLRPPHPRRRRDLVVDRGWGWRAQSPRQPRTWAEGFATLCRGSVGGVRRPPSVGQ